MLIHISPIKLILLDSSSGTAELVVHWVQAVHDRRVQVVHWELVVHRHKKTGHIGPVQLITY